jgi:hypothetical protein
MQKHAIARRFLATLSARKEVVIVPSRFPGYWELAVDTSSPLLLVKAGDLAAVLQ